MARSTVAARRSSAQPRAVADARPRAVSPDKGLGSLADTAYAAIKQRILSLELRPGRHGELVIHALRPEGHEAPPIKDVTLERSAEDGSLTIKVVIAGGQKAGNYRAAIIAAATNKAVGALSVRVQAKKR